MTNADLQAELDALQNQLAAALSGHELAVAAGQEWKRKAEAAIHAAFQEHAILALQNRELRKALEGVKWTSAYTRELEAALVLIPTKAEKIVAAMEKAVTLADKYADCVAEFADQGADACAGACGEHFDAMCVQIGRYHAAKKGE